MCFLNAKRFPNRNVGARSQCRWEIPLVPKSLFHLIIFQRFGNTAFLVENTWFYKTLLNAEESPRNVEGHEAPAQTDSTSRAHGRQPGWAALRGLCGWSDGCHMGLCQWLGLFPRAHGPESKGHGDPGCSSGPRGPCSAPCRGPAASEIQPKFRWLRKPPAGRKGEEADSHPEPPEVGGGVREPPRWTSETRNREDPGRMSRLCSLPWSLW